jgi:hypothetical protein
LETCDKDTSSDDRRELNYAIDSETESISLNSKQLSRNNLSTHAHVTENDQMIVQETSNRKIASQDLLNMVYLLKALHIIISINLTLPLRKNKL